MTPQRYFLAQAYNNAWANHRLLKACSRLTPEEFAAMRVGFFPSIVPTLNHTLRVDWLSSEPAIRRQDVRARPYT